MSCLRLPEPAGGAPGIVCDRCADTNIVTTTRPSRAAADLGIMYPLSYPLGFLGMLNGASDPGTEVCSRRLPLAARQGHDDEEAERGGLAWSTRSKNCAVLLMAFLQ